jgi:hypothetical protein
LGDGNFVFHERTRESQAGCRAADTPDHAVAVSQPGHKVLKGIVEFLEVAGFGFDAGDRASEFAVLGIVGVGNDFHRSDDIDREIDGGAARNRVGDIGTVHQSAALRASSAFEIDMSVGAAENSGNEWKGTFKSFVHVGGITQGRCRDCFGRSSISVVSFLAFDDYGAGDCGGFQFER